MLFLAAVAHARPVWRVDASPIAAEAGVWPLSSVSPCPEGELVPLGVAIVIYGRRSGASTYGHASLRTTWCEAGGFHDAEYEVYRLGGWNEQMLRAEHAGEPWVEEALDEQRGAAVLFRVEHPVDGGWYRESMLDNREPYELWLDLPEERAVRVIREAEAWYEEQRASLAAHEPLTPSYLLWKRNCTLVLRRLLPELDPGSALPFVWMRSIEEEVPLRVMHPSSAVARRWADDWPVEAERPHPFVRPGKRWPTGIAVEDPVVPWTR
ncbi:MAG: hypothetical protein KC621_11765 [Myxococcales bacterium]|nr:hypothetical protein [Myxococcales bacterium]